MFKVAKVLRIALFFIFITLVACEPSGPHQPSVAPKSGSGEVESGQNDPNSTLKVVTFEDVKPILGKFCMECHGKGGSASTRNWVDFEYTKKNKGKLQTQVVAKKEMPKKTSSNYDEFTDKERNLIAAWISSGAYENQASVPQAPASGEGSTGNADNTGGGSTVGDGGSQGGADTEEEEVVDLDQVKRELVASCTGCHGEKGMSGGGAPHLAGLSRDYILTQLKAFTGEYDTGAADGVKARTDSETMTDILSYIEEPTGSEADDEVKEFTKLNKLEYLADHFGRLKFTASDIELWELDADERIIYKRGEELSNKSACMSCHTNVKVPQLAGQDSDYIQTSLNAFKDKTRPAESMYSVVEYGQFSDEDIEALGLYFSRQLKVELLDMTLLSEKNVSHYYTNMCTTCHTEPSPDPRVPNINGLDSTYTKKQFKDFVSGKRKDSVYGYMPTVLQDLTRKQLDILKDYVTGLDVICNIPTEQEEGFETPVQEDEDYIAGEKLAKRCLSCHQKVKRGYPLIYGRKAEYLLHTLKVFQDPKIRNNPIMKAQVKKMTDKQLEQISFYLSEQRSCAPR